MNKLDPEQSLISTIASSDLSGLVADGAELMVDQLFDDALLKEIPVISTIRSLIKIPISIRDYLFVKKLYRFLAQLKDIPLEERCRLADRLGTNETERKRTGENLLLVLDRLNDIQKPNILGKIFADYLRGGMDYPTLQRLAFCLERLNLALVPNLLTFYRKLPYEPSLLGEEILQDLAMCGLVRLVPGSGAVGGGGGYFHSELGKIFINYLI